VPHASADDAQYCRNARLAAEPLLMIQASGIAASDSRPLVFSIALFLLPALALTSRFGITLLELATIVGAIWYARVLWQQRETLFGPARYIMLAVTLSFLLSAASVLLSGFDARFVENPLKAFLVLPVIGLAALGRPKADWLWYGLAVGTSGAAIIACYQRVGLQAPRAEGFHMAIMFGDVAMAMGLMSLAGIQRFSKTRLAFLPLITFTAGVIASVLSGTRGGWMALVLSFIPLYTYGRHAVGRRILMVGLAGLALIIGAIFIPQLGVQQRLLDIGENIHQYQAGDPNTSIGLRFENWKGAAIIFSEHPLTGIGRANYERGLNDLVAQKKLHPSVIGLRHAHNELLNAFAAEGIVGGLALIFLYAAPFLFFLQQLRHEGAAQPYALAGLLLVLSFIDFGLTQVLFAHHIGSAFYTLMIGTLAGLCIGLRHEPR
jgi:O-antigen ligase